jgi:hypothetical protein
LAPGALGNSPQIAARPDVPEIDCGNMPMAGFIVLALVSTQPHPSKRATGPFIRVLGAVLHSNMLQFTVR